MEVVGVNIDSQLSVKVAVIVWIVNVSGAGDVRVAVIARTVKVLRVGEVRVTVKQYAVATESN